MKYYFFAILMIFFNNHTIAQSKESRLCKEVETQIKSNQETTSLDISGKFNFLLKMNINEIINEMKICEFSFSRNDENFPNTILAERKFKESFIGYSYIQFVLKYESTSLEKYKVNIFYRGL